MKTYKELVTEIGKFKSREIAWELRHEPRDRTAQRYHHVTINDKHWKTFGSRSHAEKVVGSLKAKYPDKKIDFHSSFSDTPHNI